MSYPYDPPWFDKLAKGELSMDMEDALPLWAIYAMMKKRGIGRQHIAAHLGISRQRVQKMLTEGGDSHARLEEAITSITIQRHEGSHPGCDNASCAVYHAAGVDTFQARKMTTALEEDKREHPEVWNLEDENIEDTPQRGSS